MQSPSSSLWLALASGAAGVLLLVALGLAVPRWPWQRSCCAPVPEMKSNLKALYMAERSYYQERDAYAPSLRDSGFSPELGNAYTYFGAESGPVWRPEERRMTVAGMKAPPFQVIPGDPDARRFKRSWETFSSTGCPLTRAPMPDGSTAGLGVTVLPGKPETAVFIAAAAGDIDKDPTPDCWSIATVERVAADGTLIPPGQPHQELDDMEH